MIVPFLIYLLFNKEHCCKKKDVLKKVSIEKIERDKTREREKK